MKKAKQNHIEQLFDEGEFIYDEVDYEDDFILLKDKDGEVVAKVDLKNQKDTFYDDYIYLGEKKYKLNSMQKNYILEYMEEKFQHEIQSKAERRKEKQEIPYHDLNN